MLEQKYFIDPNTIECKKPLGFLRFQFGEPLVIANAAHPYHDEEFVMLPNTYSQSETIRKLVSLRNKTTKELGLGQSGEDYILGPNIDSQRSYKARVINWGDASQLRVWVRDTLRERN